MELVKGQNITLPSTQGLVIDIGWRSLATDLNLKANAVYVGSIDSTQKTLSQNHLIDIQNQTLSPHVSRDKDGRHYILDLEKLANHMSSFTLLLMLPKKSAYDFSKVANLQGFISTKEGNKLANIKIDDYQAHTNAMSLIEIYKHKQQWKLKLVCQEFKQDYQYLADHYNFISLSDAKRTEPVIEKVAIPEPNHHQTQPNMSDNARELAPHTLREGVSLDMGESLSLTDHFNHIRQITWKVRCLPALNDIKLSVLALDNDNKMQAIEDYVYQHNPVLKGGGVTLEADTDNSPQAAIHFDKLSDKVHKLYLIATRANDTKRFSSADVIQTKLHSSATELNVCRFSLASVDKNYNAVILLELYRHNSQWKVKAVGQGYAKGIQAIGEAYGFSAPKHRSKNVATKPIPHNSTNSANTNQSGEQNSNSTIAPDQTIPATTGRLGIAMCILAVFTLPTSLASPFMLIVTLALVSFGIYSIKQARSAATKTLAEHNERFVLNLIAQNNYHITPFEIAAQHTITVEQATKILDELCAKGAGKLSSNDSGSLVYQFDSIKAQNTTSVKQSPTW